MHEHMLGGVPFADSYRPARSRPARHSARAERRVSAFTCAVSNGRYVALECEICQPPVTAQRKTANVTRRRASPPLKNAPKETFPVYGE